MTRLTPSKIRAKMCRPCAKLMEPYAGKMIVWPKLSPIINLHRRGYMVSEITDKLNVHWSVVQREIMAYKISVRSRRDERDMIVGKTRGSGYDRQLQKVPYPFSGKRA